MRVHVQLYGFPWHCRGNFDRQYWGIKRKHMDLVLFVRVGSFYELYDTDADVSLVLSIEFLTY